MMFRLTALVGSVATSLVLLAAPAAWGQGRDGLEMYTLQGPADKVAEATQGVELAGVRADASGIKAEAVLTRGQRAKLAASGVQVELTRNRKGQTVTEQAAARRPAATTSSGPGTSRAASATSSTSVARENPQLVKLEVLGTTHQGRELIALKLTQGARGVPDGSRPAVLYSSNQHAREWISLEVNRRLLHYFIDRWRANDKDDQGPAQEDRAVVRDLREPRRLPVHLRPRAAVAQEPARQQRRRADHGRRRRRSEPQLRRALGLRQRGLVAGSGGRDLPRSQRGLGAGDPGDAGADQPHQAEVPVEPALVR